MHKYITDNYKNEVYNHSKTHQKRRSIMKKVAQFEKVSFEQFKKDWLAEFPAICDIEALYESIKLPRRATIGSAGYDFFVPEAFTLSPGSTIKIPTGIRVRIDEGWVLKIYPRSGLGFKFRLQLNNTVGIIDSDYYNSSNEGHIMIRITNDSNEEKTLELRKGDGFCQGIFVEYGITYDDDADGTRDGGFGSTSK